MTTYKINPSKGPFFCYLLVPYKSTVLRVRISPDYSGHINSVSITIPRGFSEKKICPIIQQILKGKTFQSLYRRHIAARGYNFWLKNNPAVLPDYQIWAWH